MRINSYCGSLPFFLIGILLAITLSITVSAYAQTSQNTLSSSLTLQDQSSCSTIQGNWTSGNSTCTITNNLTINPHGGSLTINSGIILDISTNGTISNSGPINNYGTIVNSGKINLSSSEIINNYGTITNNGIINNVGFIQDFCTAIFTGSSPIGVPVHNTQCMPTTFGISVLHNPSIFGQLVTFTVIVSSNSEVTSDPFPTGIVQFIDASTNPPTILDTGSLVAGGPVTSGATTFSTSSLSIGSHNIAIKYLGDSYYRNGSSVIVQTVNNPAIATSSNSSVNENMPLQIMLTGNDLLGKQITYAITTKPSEGILSKFNPTTGSVTYTPNRDYVGNDDFTFTTSDSSLQSTVATFDVTVIPVSYTPTAIVGAGQTVNAGSTVTLNGTGSIDPYYNTIMKYYSNGQTQPIANYLKYSWSQTSGIPVTLSNPSSANPTFTAPSASSGIILQFMLTVSDKGSSTSSPILITVQPSKSLASTQPTQNPTTNNQSTTSQTRSPVTTQQTQPNPTLSPTVPQQVSRPISSNTNQSSAVSVQNPSPPSQNNTLQTNNTTSNPAQPQNELTSPQPPYSTPEIPQWVKNNARWWSEGSVGDNDFVKGVQYLIQQKIINIQSQSTTTEAQQIPAWVKNTAGMWASGTISDNDFLRGIEYLVQIGIIKV